MPSAFRPPAPLAPDRRAVGGRREISVAGWQASSRKGVRVSVGIGRAGGGSICLSLCTRRLSSAHGRSLQGRRLQSAASRLARATRPPDRCKRASLLIGGRRAKALARSAPASLQWAPPAGRHMRPDRRRHSSERRILAAPPGFAASNVKRVARPASGPIRSGSDRIASGSVGQPTISRSAGECDCWRPAGRCVRSVWSNFKELPTLRRFYKLRPR